MSKIVIALGGNALGKDPKEQLSLLQKASQMIAKLIKDGNKIVLTHGNGPQIGQISLAMEYASRGDPKTPLMPFPECGSMSQGYIGYQIQQCLQSELEHLGIPKNCATIITQVLVDQNDSAFQNPTKPIGMFYTQKEAKTIEKEKGYQFIEDSGRGFRRVVPSPKPVDIIERNIIKQLMDQDNIIIAVGGGGIPVIKESKTGQLTGVEAVIDKDKSASLLAKAIKADILLILTAVDKVYLNYNRENQMEIDKMNLEDCQNYIKAGHFAKGSMLPKIEACMEFVKESDTNIAIISSLEKASDAIKGKTGTIIKRR